MTKGIIIFGSLAAATALTGVFLYYKKQAELAQDMTFEVTGISIKQLSLIDTNIIELDMKISSQSTLQALVKKIAFSIYVNDAEIGSVKSVDAFRLPTRGFTNVKVQVDVLPKAVLDNVFDIATFSFKNKSASLVIKGSSLVKVALFTISVPFESETTVGKILKS